MTTRFAGNTAAFGTSKATHVTDFFRRLLFSKPCLYVLIAASRGHSVIVLQITSPIRIIHQVKCF